ncbi:hypothetical protein ACFL10_01810 [Patescibacteria group bacterium]
MTKPEFNEFSDTPLGRILQRHEVSFEKLRSAPVRIDLEVSVSAGKKFICKIYNPGFSLVFGIERNTLSKQDLEAELIEELSRQGIAVES